MVQSGAGLIFVEYSFVHASGRSEVNQLGISTGEHIDGLSRIAEIIHQSGAVAGIQLSHGGGKSHRELTGGKLLTPSGIAVPSQDAVQELPDVMDRADIEIWQSSFVDAARRGIAAGFDLIEFHSAHGYGLNQWLSPLTNQRQDAYGGSLENRSRMLLEIIAQVRSLFAQHALAARIPGQDFLPGGLGLGDMVWVAQRLQAGLNLLDVSSGLGGWRRPRDHKGEGYLVAEASAIQQAVSIPVIGVGGIQSAEYIDHVIGKQQISLAAVGRAILADPQAFKQRILRPPRAIMKNSMHSEVRKPCLC
ncbi:MAG: NADH:flavin oxidoreductase [Myxococcota bacterium]